ncbi:ParB/RepB/Spo0J family partition protein [Variovorax sp. OV329]|uniref:ParB/RepB/Spo0J family partition protein n=1 Tax=Variovorax sp. OV329 TaxID=1882825 RepID=UPI0008DF7C63|nr:ParB/RepB/Spo0J family partition protein [Variovorax sp. OV329]SFN47723.1 chromosome partitioning protein, ParB family [Variovorax sp. OV329]
MLAFRGQMQAVEGELSTLREKLSLHQDSLPTKRLDPQLIEPSHWANRHGDSFKTAEFAGLKADIEKAGGNVQPILVRPLSQKEGRYELVFGHRRHRASLELGIPVLAMIWTDDLADAELFAAMDRENREREDLSPYEQGSMYRRALEEGLFPTQRRMAEQLGVSHTWIQKTLRVAQLPPAILECFKSPLDVTCRQAEVIQASLDKDGRGVLKRAEKLRGQQLAASAVVSRLLDNKPAAKAQQMDVRAGDKLIGKATLAPDGGMTIDLKGAAVGSASNDEILQAVRAILDKFNRTAG